MEESSAATAIGCLALPPTLGLQFVAYLERCQAGSRPAGAGSVAL